MASAKWKGGKGITKAGYVTLTVGVYRSKNSRVYEHRLVVEQKLGRTLGRNEIVHHVNGDKLDNRLENLQVMTNISHAKLHNEARHA